MNAAPPRLPQLLLSALGARAEFREALLGDMAEEYYMRVEVQGEHAAHAWYVDEAYRAVPHLIRDGVKNLGLGGVAHVMGAAFKAYASIALIAVILLPLVKLLPHSVMGAAMNIVVSAMGTVAGGYLAARFGRRAPLLSSAALGASWATVYTAALLFVLEILPRLGAQAWYNFPSTANVVFAGPAIILVGTVLGGIFQIARRRVA